MKKINKANSVTRGEYGRLRNREKKSSPADALLEARKNPVRFPKLLVILLLTIIAMASAAVLAFVISQQSTINDNKRQFSHLRTMTEYISKNKAIGVEGIDWIRSERCVSTPFNDFELSYGARKEWVCFGTTQRAVGTLEDKSAIQSRLALAVSEHFEIKERRVSEQGSLMMITNLGMKCSVSLGLEDEYGESGGVIVGCSDGAYKPWYNRGML